VVVVDHHQGKVIAQATGSWQTAEVAWLEQGGDEPPLLLVATGEGLAAFAVEAE